jgi:hypothetical protein
MQIEAFEHRQTMYACVPQRTEHATSALHNTHVRNNAPTSNLENYFDVADQDKLPNS